MDSESIGNRITKLIGGVFLFFFGLPFTLVPFLIFGEFRGMDAGLSETIFLTAFAIPFFLVGLLVQFMGLSAMFGRGRVICVGSCEVWIGGGYRPVTSNLI